MEEEEALNPGALSAAMKAITNEDIASVIHGIANAARGPEA